MESTALNILIFLPLIAGIAVWTLPREREALAYQISLLVGLIVAVISFWLWWGVGGAGLQAETSLAWIMVGDKSGLTATDAPELSSGLRIAYHVGLDAISAPLLALTGLLVPLSVACSFSSIRTRVREYYAWLLLLTAGMFGVFSARDVLLFYVFFEFTLVPLYFLIGIWGGSDRKYAANKFFLYTFAGSVITFAGILYLATRGAAASAAAGNGYVVTFDLLTLSSLTLSQTEQILLFAALFCGFAIKVPFFPLHTWLPLAHTEAPTAGSVLLAGVLLKLGTYGFLRFSLPMVPAGAEYWAVTMGWLSVIGIIYGALCCWVQQDVKKLVAYSSVSHLGFCMLGMFSLLPVGVSGSVLYMINHGLSTGALFLCVGMIYERYHTRDMNQLGGLAKQMPILAAFLMLFTFSSVGLPGLNGFVSEFTVLFAAYNSPTLGPLFGALGATGILLGAIYMLYMAGKVLFGPLKEPHHTPDIAAVGSRDLNPREIATLVPLAVLCVVLGVAPRLITDTLDPALQAQVLGRFATARTAPSNEVVSAAREESPHAPVAADRAGDSPALSDNVATPVSDRLLAPAPVGPVTPAPEGAVTRAPVGASRKEGL